MSRIDLNALLNVDEEVKKAKRVLEATQRENERVKKETVQLKRDADKEIAGLKQEANDAISVKEKEVFKKEKEIDKIIKTVSAREKDLVSIEKAMDRLSATKDALAKERKEIDVLRTDLTSKIKLAELREEQARKAIEEAGGVVKEVTVAKKPIAKAKVVKPKKKGK